MYAKFLLILLVISSNALAAPEVVLINRLGVMSSQYGRLVQNLRPGTQFRMAGTLFTSYGILGVGGRNTIVDIGEGRALRIPNISEVEFYPAFGLRGMPIVGWTHPREYITSYLDGYQDLKEHGAHTVRVFPELSKPGAYAVMERIDVQFTLHDFLARLRGLPESRLSQGTIARIDASDSEILKDKLVEFAQSFWAFKNVGDFRVDQVAWTGERWILLDWTHLHNVFGRFRRDQGFVYPDGERESSPRSSALLQGVYAGLFSVDPIRCRKVSDFFDEARRLFRHRLPVRCAEALTGHTVGEMNPFGGE